MLPSPSPYRCLFVGSGAAYLAVCLALAFVFREGDRALVRIVEPSPPEFRAVRLLLARLSVAWDCRLPSSAPPSASDVAYCFDDDRFSFGNVVVELLGCDSFEWEDRDCSYLGLPLRRPRSRTSARLCRV
mmetsp:Transcript_18911/g.28462  ORF Transcript_18911/g.28462 Transcript_18911/m.28462 type:complete len:130 (-) Transcript_18911:396-785(-)